MLDKPLIQLLRGIIVANLAGYGITATDVLQKNQPTTQGAASRAAIYLTKLFDNRYGWMQRKDEWNAVDEKIEHTEMQIYQSTFQVEALVPQDPAALTGLTASDVVNWVSLIMQSDVAIAALRVQDVQILRITDIRNPYFSDDKNRFEAAPSFDFTVTHKQVKVTTNDDAANRVEFGIYRV